MLNTELKKIEIILGSQSPRRKDLLASLDIDFEVLIKSVDESIPETITSSEAAVYVAKKKLDAFDNKQYYNNLIITADTVVVDKDDNVLGKPSSQEEARSVISSLSNSSHIVYTGVAMKYKGKEIQFTDQTLVYFENVSEEEIDYYINTYKPYDKAGAYGIQEWIGRIAVSRIEGSFENVMGLPTVKLYKAIKEIIQEEEA